MSDMLRSNKMSYFQSETPSAFRALFTFSSRKEGAQCTISLIRKPRRLAVRVFCNILIRVAVLQSLRCRGAFLYFVFARSSPKVGQDGGKDSEQDKQQKHSFLIPQLLGLRELVPLARGITKPFS